MCYSVRIIGMLYTRLVMGSHAYSHMGILKGRLKFTERRGDLVYLVSYVEIFCGDNIYGETLIQVQLIGSGVTRIR